MEHEDIVGVAARKLPRELREDAIQAGYVGLLNGLKNKDSIKTNLRGYLYRCVANEMIREAAKLHRPFSLNSSTFNQLLKYKKLKRFGKPVCNTMSVEELERILNVKQWSLDHE